MEQRCKRRRNYLRLNIHFVWATKDRLPLIEDQHERALYRHTVSIFERYEGSILAIGGMPDHVHVLVSISPKYAMSEVIKNVKGGSSRYYSDTLQPEGWFEWQPNYAAISVGHSHVRRVPEYILNQKQHHQAGSTQLRFEQTDQEEDGVDDNL